MRGWITPTVVGLCLLVGPAWVRAQLPIPPAQPNVGAASSPASPSQFLRQVLPTPAPITVPAAADPAPLAGKAPVVALPARLSRAPVEAGGASAAAPAAPPAAGPHVVRLTLDEVKERVLGNSKLLALAAMNVQSKGYATKAMEANYFPQIIGQSVYLHFNDFLGSVLTTGRTVRGPRGRALLTIPSNTVDVAVINQDTALNNLAAVQPLTDLLKVKQGVK